MAITQTPYQIGIAVYDTDGTTKLYDNGIEKLAPGVTPPVFPGVGDDIEFVVGGTNHVSRVRRKTMTYFVGDGVSISTLIVIEAVKK